MYRFSAYFSLVCKKKIPYTCSKQYISLCILKALCLHLQCARWTSHYVTQASFIKSVILLPPPLKMLLQLYVTTSFFFVIFLFLTISYVYILKSGHFNPLPLFMPILIVMQYSKSVSYILRDWNFYWTSQPKLITYLEIM